MATHQPAMQVDVEEAVREMLAVEVEAEEQDPFEGMGNAQVAEIYHRIKPEDQRLFRQFKRFHKQYYETHGHNAPSHQLTHGIIQQMFPRLPSADADTIAKARAELLATEQLKELCKQLGLAVPTQLQEYPPPPEAPEYQPTPQPPQFLSRQNKEYKLEACRSHKRAELNPGLTLAGKLQTVYKPVPTVKQCHSLLN